jgi:membrane-associated protein
VSLLAALPDLHASVHPMLLGIKILDPEYLKKYGDSLVWIGMVMLFVECGLFFPFLPGDTLLFSIGLFIAATGAYHLSINLAVAMAMLMVAAILGNLVGYEIGRRIGPPIYERDGRLLKRKYFDQTTAFFDKHGNKALVIGRFVPFVRTYITVVAGASKMARQKFFYWSAVGASLWVLLITLLGYFLGSAFPSLGQNIDKAIIVILALSVIPIAWEWWRHRRSADATS